MKKVFIETSEDELIKEKIDEINSGTCWKLFGRALPTIVKFTGQIVTGLLVIKEFLKAFKIIE